MTASQLPSASANTATTSSWRLLKTEMSPIPTSATADASNPIAPPRDAPSATTPLPFSPATEEILKRLPATSLSAVRNSQEWEAAREAVLKTMTTSQFQSTDQTMKDDDTESSINVAMPSTPAAEGSRGRGRGGRGGRPRGSRGRGRGGHNPTETPPSTAPNSVRGRGRGGRPRGRAGRGGRGGRKPLAEGIKIRDVSSDEDDDFDQANEGEETPLATTSRSGRAITKPSSFVPVMASPTSGNGKRKRNWGRRNPELAVCKACLRPHSPATNMIVFCDGCNSPYHRYCHHPPISQEVVDVADMEWFCVECSVQPVPDMDLDTFVAADGLTEQQRRDALQLLPPSTLVDLLLRVTTLHPSMSIYPPGIHKTPLPTTLPAILNPPTTSTDTTLSDPPHSIPDEADNSQYPMPVRPEDDVDTGYDGLDDPTANYPKPGQGLAALLPPEQDHLDWLVDDTHDVYSHFVPDGQKNGDTDVTMGGAEQH